jgi:hypothetical protein
MIKKIILKQSLYSKYYYLGPFGATVEPTFHQIFIFFLQIKYLIVSLDHFDVMMSKINFKNKKYILF